MERVNKVLCREIVRSSCQQLLAVSHVQITKLNVLSASPRPEIDVLRLVCAAPPLPSSLWIHQTTWNTDQVWAQRCNEARSQVPRCWILLQNKPLAFFPLLFGACLMHLMLTSFCNIYPLCRSRTRHTGWGCLPVPPSSKLMFPDPKIRVCDLSQRPRGPD